MQRSRSSSCIPLPQNAAKRSSKPSIGVRPRSTSTSRISGTKGYTPTPVTNKRFNSRTPTTPSCSSTSKRTNCRLFNSVSPKKLWTDKKWVAHQHSKVRDYVINNNILFEGSVVNPDQLRPPPLKSFIHIMTVLFGKLFAQVDPINQINYKEVVTKYLKIINCPVVPSMSTMKIVSSMHVFPQIMCLLSWMIDFTDDVEEEESVERVGDEYIQAYLLKKATLTHLCELYPTSTTKKFEGREYEVLEQECDEILGVDTATLGRLEKEASDNEKLYEKQEDKFKNTHEQKLTLELEITDMRDQIIEYENGKEQSIIAIKNLKPELKKIEAAIKTCEESVRTITDIVQCQKMQFREKQQIVKEIEDLKNQLTRMTENQKEINKIRDELDLQHSTLQSQVQAEVDQWNISLLRTSSGHQKVLKLREKGFHSLDFLQEIKNVKDKKSTLEDQVNKQIDDVKKKMYEVDKQKLSASNNLETESKAVASLETVIVALKNDLAELENKIHKLSENIKTHIQLQEVQSKKLKEAKKETQKKEGEIKEFQANNAKLIKEKQDLMVKGTSFFIEYHSHIMKDAQNMHVAIKNVRKMCANKLNEQNQIMAQQIKILQDMQAH